MQTLMNVVRAFLTESGHRPERRGPNLRAPIRGENGVWYLHVIVNEDDRWLICRSHVPFAVPESLRKKAAELVVRLNDSLILGNFELDFADGEVCFKTSMRFTDDEMSPAMAKDLLFCNFSIFDRYLPSFMALVYGRRSVGQAVALTGGSSDPSPQDILPQLPPAGGSDAQDRGPAR